jgi:hypothetical protein
MEDDVEGFVSLADRAYRAVIKLYDLCGMSSDEREDIESDYRSFLNSIKEKIESGQDSFQYDVDEFSTKLAVDVYNAAKKHPSGGVRLATKLYNIINALDVDKLETSVIEYKRSRPHG